MFSVQHLELWTLDEVVYQVVVWNEDDVDAGRYKLLLFMLVPVTPFRTSRYPPMGRFVGGFLFGGDSSWSILTL